MSGSKKCEPGCECAKHKPQCPAGCTCGRHKPRGERPAAHSAALSESLKGNQNSRRHGESTRAKRTPENTAWQNMRARCLRPSHPGYKDYGGRGITIDPRWDKFENFLADMGRRPGPEYSIERKDNNGPYAPWNCVWATGDVQRANNRLTRDANGRFVLGYA